ncbi:MAG: putative sulfate exporter family transporter [Antricoccus sp.]
MVQSRSTQFIDWIKKAWPGLLVVAAGTVLAYVVNHFVHGLNAGSAAVALGFIAVNVGLIKPIFGPGLNFASKKLLRLAVVLLGLQLSLGQLKELGLAGLLVVIVTVAATFFFTQWFGRLIGVNKATSLLVATGFSICGASAVAAMEPLAKGKKHDTAVSIALVTLCGSLAIVILPLLQHILGLSNPATFGSWVGASVHDVGQTVATANRVPGALQAAVIVKLTRVIMLAPLVFAVGVYMRRVAVQAAKSRTTAAAEKPGTGTGTEAGADGVTAKHPPLVPLFVAGFLVAIVLNSVLTIPTDVLGFAKHAQEILLAAALFALGTGVSWKVMKEAGGKPLVLGLVSWIVVATVAYVGVILTH